MDSHPPLNPRPLTAAPGRRNLMSVTAAPPLVTAASSEAATATAPVMVRLKRRDLSELPMNGLRAIKQLSEKRRSEQPLKSLWLSDQQPKQLSPIDRISPPPRLQEKEKARQKVLQQIQANRDNREKDRAALLERINSEPYMTQQGDVRVRHSPCKRPETVRSFRRLPGESPKSNDLKNIGSLGGGKSRKNVRRHTVKRNRRLTRNKHRRANIRGTNRK